MTEETMTAKQIFKSQFVFSFSWLKNVLNSEKSRTSHWKSENMFPYFFLENGALILIAASIIVVFFRFL